MGQLPRHAYNSGSAMVPTVNRIVQGQYPGAYAGGHDGDQGCWPNYCDPCYDQVQGAVLPPRGGYHGDKSIAGRRRAVDAIRHGTKGECDPPRTTPCNAPTGCCPVITPPDRPPLPGRPGGQTWGRKAKFGYGYGWSGAAVDDVRHGSRYMGASVQSGSRYMGARRARGRAPLGATYQAAHATAQAMAAAAPNDGRTCWPQNDGDSLGWMVCCQLPWKKEIQCYDLRSGQPRPVTKRVSRAASARRGYAGGHHEGHHHHDHDHHGKDEPCCDSCASGGSCSGCDGNCGDACTCK